LDLPFHKKLMAECLGTYVLVFAGTSAIVVNSGGAVTHVGVSLTFGLVVFALIAALGDVSGAHFNPAVSIGFWAARRFPASALPAYIGVQCLGALFASLTVRGLFSADSPFGATIPAGPPLQSFVLEFILTAFLMFVILGVSTGPKEKGITAGLAIGGVIALEALFAGPVSGASMNPARSLAPAVVSGNLSALWVYLTAPTVGALLAAPLCRCVREEGCCQGRLTGAAA
jgi:aquaporin NIP